MLDHDEIIKFYFSSLRNDCLAFVYVYRYMYFDTWTYFLKRKILAKVKIYKEIFQILQQSSF